MKVITSSGLAKFRQCPRLYQYAYEMKRVPLQTSDALTFGLAWHKAMEAWWQSPHNPEEARIRAATALVAEAENISPEDAARMAAMLKYYSPDVSDYDVVSVESKFLVPIANPTGGRIFYKFKLAGRVDVVLTHKQTGETLILDHKTTTSDIVGFDAFWKPLSIDGQMNNYCLAIGASGFIYDVVKKPTIRMCGKDEKAAQLNGTTPEAEYQKRCEEAIAESPSEYFQFRIYVKTDGDIADAQVDLWQQTEMLRSCVKADRWPRNPESCVSRYGACPYLDVCTGRAELEDDALFRTKEAQHEELEDASTVALKA